jgi:hypothetical protein
VLLLLLRPHLVCLCFPISIIWHMCH